MDDMHILLDKRWIYVFGVPYTGKSKTFFFMFRCKEIVLDLHQPMNKTRDQEHGFGH